MMNNQAHRLVLQKLHSQRQCLAPLVATTTAIVLYFSSCSRSPQKDARERTLNRKWREFKNFDAAMPSFLTHDITVLCEKGEKTADPYSEPYRFAECLEYHRSLIDDYRQRWTYSPESQRIPSTSSAWPSNAVPSPQEISTLEYDLKFATPGKYRDDVQFRLAKYYLDDDPSQALSLLQDLAVRGNHADAMCLFGIVWNEGRCNVEADPAKACVWFTRAAEMGHAQACYELAVSLYTGEGVAENEEMAVEWFEQAAAMGHAAAAYMLGDCLLDGVGVVRDRAEALEWLVAAGEMGHRGARSRVLAVLEQEEWKDYGSFTDGSRQTFKRKIESELEHKKWTEANVEKIVSIERQFTVGGGSGNPIVLERRQSVIAESRERENSIPTATDYVRRAASQPPTTSEN
mmetsp:Transcript_5414/g.7826  ORF Transcript_5414/g.7826 Transcript_5414/m.7826 type:complete len:403 (+) Transcript_5414:38-1246(+)|eukprot:CAMPEP_0194199652 /NCGR_PEP_ID=MMETSP0156-20130528/594_1 /TAXON_ID=33649 /ORGANISM="Thalassionema nitzschioides, Strain L26-B" /LENGTH=402 /DNA_ID=CAMNT_0038924583 /DNA_START=1 /DNA_END=1209 /DNA_ORIENTATION=+